MARDMEELQEALNRSQSFISTIATAVDPNKLSVSYAMSCDVMLCYVMLSYVMLCDVMLCYVTLCNVVIRYDVLCYFKR